MQLHSDDGRGLTRATDASDAHHLHHTPAAQMRLHLDPVSRVLSWRGKRLRLTPAQSSLMLLLMESAPDPVPASEIWANVHGYIPTTPSSALRVLIHSLRVACKQTFGRTFTRTVRRHGYRLANLNTPHAPANVSKN